MTCAGILTDIEAGGMTKAGSAVKFDKYDGSIILTDEMP
jgi:hypothetical protein